jgi:DNA-binding CsgD family transcriptional regulator
LAVAAARVAAGRGDVNEARRRSTVALERADALGFAVGEAIHRSVLGFVELSLGRPGAALEQLRPAWETFDELGVREPGLRPELGDTLEALIAVGELDEAARRLEPWELRARELDRAWVRAMLARCRGLLLAAHGDLLAALRSLDEALAEHARVLHPFEHGRTLLALGATQRRAKKRGAARATLEQALAVFEGLGARLWADKARAELARIGGRTPAGRDLTEAETRIAALVAEGRSNREVAAALFLTEHTVETALTRIYRKLGVRSRTALAQRLSAKT